MISIRKYGNARLADAAWAKYARREKTGRHTIKIYPAGPMFSEAERAWHAAFKAKLQAAGYDVLWSSDLFAAGEKVTAKQIMAADRDALLSFDVVVALLSGEKRS